MFQSSDKSLGLFFLQSGHSLCPTGVLAEALPWMETASADFQGSFRSLLKVNHLVSLTTDLNSAMAQLVLVFIFILVVENQGMDRVNI